MVASVLKSRCKCEQLSVVHFLISACILHTDTSSTLVSCKLYSSRWGLFMGYYSELKMYVTLRFMTLHCNTCIKWRNTTILFETLYSSRWGLFMGYYSELKMYVTLRFMTLHCNTCIKWRNATILFGTLNLRDIKIHDFSLQFMYKMA